MVSKDVALNLRKYKLGVGTKTPSKRSKSRGEDPESPSVRFESNGNRRPRGKSNDAQKLDSDSGPVLTNAIRKHLRDLDSGVADKISLLKMLVIKSDEADQNLNRLRTCINHGQIDAAER